MRNTATKISLFILTGIIISACDAVKRVPDGKKLLTNTEIFVNDKKENAENVSNLLYQKPNSSILGYRLRLNLYNLAKLNHDSLYKAKFVNDPDKYRRKSKWLSAKQVNRLGESFYYAGIHNFLRDTGEPPVIIDPKSTNKSALRLKSYYFNNGFFRAKTRFENDSTAPKKGKIKYFVTTGEPFIIDTVKISIKTPVLDSMYQLRKENSFIKSGKQYRTIDIDDERNRITTQFRNNGVYQFQQNFINFTIDTLNSNFKANVDLKINDYSYREGDSTKTEPFKIYKISEVNIYTDYNPNNKSTANDTIKTTYNNFNLLSTNKLKYRPKAITDAVFISKGNLFADFRTTLTSRYLSNLKIFNYPTIQYEVDKKDTLSNSLIANIYLTPRKKYSFGYSFDLTHSSNIQDFGISGSTSLTIRNIFNGAETLAIAARGNIGSSRALANPDDNFFNVSEYGLDMKLNFPRIFMFFNTEKIIPKSMIPSTTVSLGFAKQQNIGLDKENFTGAMTYTWNPKRYNTARFELFNIQYVKNINIGNYFKVYNSSYRRLNSVAQAYNANPAFFEDGNLIIEEGTNAFIEDVLGENPSVLLTEDDRKTVSSIDERKSRLTENNLIFASSYSFTKTTKFDIKDEDYYAFKTKIESAGNFLSLIAAASKQLKNQNGNNTIFDVEYSQYIKGEIEYIKHWDLNRKKVLAFRSFVGIAIPYGNSNSIPFSRSYFAGGSNDNRGWQAYSLGPGGLASINDFNEANLKIAASTEFRFNFFGQFNGALFVDAGNIWNVLDNVEEERAVFSGINSLRDTAVGSGFGFRYDFNFFVVRLDLGFKTYNPADESGKKWFRDYNFGNSVLNIGINYPF